jgi:hypothetical protein
MGFTLAMTAGILGLLPATALAAADLSAAVTQSAPTVRVGDTVDVTFSLANRGPDAAVSPRLAGLWDVSRLSFVRVVNTSGAIDGSVFDTGTVWLTGPARMAAGETDSVTLRLRAIAAGAATAQAGVTGPADGNAADDAAQSTVSVTTTGAPRAGGGQGGAGSPGGGTAKRPRLSLKASKRLGVRGGRRLRLAYRAGAAGRIRLDVLKGRKRVGRVRTHARKGHNRIAWRARSHGHALKRGRYTYRLTLRSGKRTAVVSGTIRVRRR